MKKITVFSVLVLLCFGGLVLILSLGLQRDPGSVPSPFIGKAMPDFKAPRLMNMDTIISQAELQGKPVLLNVWASWCRGCQDEHALLMELSRHGKISLYGLNYKDKPEDARRWLHKYGNPYRQIIFDPQGDTAIEWGVYGIPETFLVDAMGTVVYKHVGAIKRKTISDIILPFADAQQ